MFQEAMQECLQYVSLKSGWLQVPGPQRFFPKSCPLGPKSQAALIDPDRAYNFCCRIAQTCSKGKKGVAEAIARSPASPDM